MAILEDLGLEVKVLVGGEAVPEYPDPEPDVVSDSFDAGTKSCHRYVQSRQNEEFVISVGLSADTASPARKWVCIREHSFVFDISIDGGRCGAVARVVSDDYKASKVTGIHNRANGTERRFRFATVSTVDEANKKKVAEDLKIAQHLGLIRITVQRVRIKGLSMTYIPDYSRPNDSVQDRNGISLSEKSLKGKAVSHAAKLSRPVKVDMPNYVECEYLDTKQAPYAVFYLKYRSLDDLEKMLIIPPRPTLPASLPDDLQDLSPEDVHRLARERLEDIRGGKKRAASVKIEREEAQVPRSGRPYKYVRIQGGKKAIDLTDDD